MNEPIHINALSNGLGSQSMALFLMACYLEIPATASITADTGWEKDRTWSNGRKSSLREYFDEVVAPLGAEYGVKTLFVRAADKHGKPLMGLIEHTRWCATTGKFNNLKIPMFGSKGGRMGQSCTEKWKIRAINQTLRKLGAKTACTAQGIHIHEAARRVKGTYLRKEGEWSIYQTTQRKTVKLADGTKGKVEVPIKWLTHYYPHVDLGCSRSVCQLKVQSAGIPYLISSECDGCPHKDYPRWERTSQEVIEELAEVEKLFNGLWFFTPERIPLIQAIEVMRGKYEANQPEPDFGCEQPVCGV
jgi:hypothetical protein